MKAFSIVLLTLLLSACATPEYQKAGENGVHRIGYTDIKLTDNSYRITYLGSDANNAYLGFMRRASDLTLTNGFTHFTSSEAGSSKENSTLVHMGYGVVQDVALPQHQATITMHKSSVPNSISAEDFLKNNPIPKKTKKAATTP